MSGREDVAESMRRNLGASGGSDLLYPSALARAFGVGHEVPLHTNALLLLKVDPTFWEEGVRVWEYVRVNLVEYWSHADDGLETVRSGQRYLNKTCKRGRVWGVFECYVIGIGDSYIGWYLPILVVEGFLGKALMPSDFTGTKSSGGQLAGSAMLCAVRRKRTLEPL